jgi:hypothetical protein
MMQRQSRVVGMASADSGQGCAFPMQWQFLTLPVRYFFSRVRNNAHVIEYQSTEPWKGSMALQNLTDAFRLRCHGEGKHFVTVYKVAEVPDVGMLQVLGYGILFLCHVIRPMNHPYVVYVLSLSSAYDVCRVAAWPVVAEQMPDNQSFWNVPLTCQNPRETMNPYAITVKVASAVPCVCECPAPHPATIGRHR